MSICPSVSPHVSASFPPDGFQWNLVLSIYTEKKTVHKINNLLTDRTQTWRHYSVQHCWQQHMYPSNKYRVLLRLLVNDFNIIPIAASYERQQWEMTTMSHFHTKNEYAEESPRCSVYTLPISFFWPPGGAVGWGTALQAGRSRVRFPDDVTGVSYWHDPSGRIMALGSTQPVTEMSTRNISWG